MKNQSNLNSLLPVPREVRLGCGRMEVRGLQSIHCAPGLERFLEVWQRAFAYFGVRLQRTGTSEAGAVIALDTRLPAEGWRLEVENERLHLYGGSPAGIFYGTGALKQLLTIAFSKGLQGVHDLDCGTIIDEPRYAWRGFMLDSARHFQSVDKVKELIRHLADYRINVLHWHLTDDTGWRIPSRIVPKLKSLGTLEYGQYTRAEIRDIVRYASEHFIRIVPEIDLPGHSRGLLQAYPHLACNTDEPGREYCLGSAETKQFIIELLGEVAGLFPESDVIHIGGDEASTENWENCSRCRRAMEEKGIDSFRALEAQFMGEVSREIAQLGRRAMMWATDWGVGPDTIIQGWRSLFDISNAFERGSDMVFSVHHHLYFDYPESAGEPSANWMPLLPEETVYATDPRVHVGPEVDGKMLGVEACLWTETVPQWRVIPKTLSRLPAFGELAWSFGENRDWYDFTGRKQRLEACGYNSVRDGVRMLLPDGMQAR